MITREDYTTQKPVFVHPDTGREISAIAYFNVTWNEPWSTRRNELEDLKDELPQLLQQED